MVSETSKNETGLSVLWLIQRISLLGSIRLTSDLFANAFIYARGAVVERAIKELSTREWHPRSPAEQKSTRLLFLSPSAENYRKITVDDRAILAFDQK